MKSRVIKCTVFLLLLGICFFRLQRVFNIGDGYRGFQSVTGLYKESSRTIDAFCIGSSNTYTSWQAPLGWDDYGISVYALSTSGMPARAFRYEIEEARKTQPDALFVLTVNCFRVTPQVARTHILTDYMPFSANKVHLIQSFSDCLKMDFFEALEFYFPSIRFHSKWVTPPNLSKIYSDSDVKSATTYNSFFNKFRAETNPFAAGAETGELNEEQAEVITDLLDYCESNKVKVLFLLLPQAVDEQVTGQYNTLKAIISERGFDLLDLRNSLEEMGIDEHTDYQDNTHMNIHASLKYVHYFGQYLCEHYGFTDKRGDPAYDSWDEASERYQTIIAAHTLDFEREHLERDYALKAPELGKVAADGNSLTLSWKESAGADGYVIYRKASNDSGRNWEEIQKTDSGENSFVDEDLQKGTTYTYTVVPVREAENGIAYGCFSYTGVSGKTEA